MILRVSSIQERSFYKMEGLEKEIQRCVKCGSCRGYCPIFAEIQREPAVARGKIALIEALLQGRVDFSKRVAEILSQCLLCGICEENCANQVNVPEIISKIRIELVKKRGLGISKRAILQIFFIFLKGYFFWRLFLLPKESGLRLRFPFFKERFIPPLSKRPFLKVQKREKRPKREGLAIGFFVGCIINYIFPQVGAATLRVLKGYRVSFSLPQGQRCCGLLAYSIGDLKGAKALALHNVKIFERSKVDYIVATCAACSSHLKRYYERMFKEDAPQLRERVYNFCGKIKDISELLINILGLPTFSSPPNLNSIRITYHHPCHLRGQGITKEPKIILNSIPSVEFVETQGNNLCCGGGGSFNLTHYGLSLKILHHKMEEIQRTKAKVVATSCMGCMLQLMDGVQKTGMNLQVCHLIELLERDMPPIANE